MKRALVLGAGPTRFGVGHELDHGRIVAVRMLRAAGFHVAVLDSNPALLPQLEADTVYLEPLDATSVARALARENAAVLVPMWGGELAHEVAAALEASGELARLGVTVLGANGAHVSACANASERARFLSERQDRVFESVEAELLLEPNRAPLLVSVITGLDDVAIHPKDAIGVLGASAEVRAAVTEHVTKLAARVGCVTGAFYVHLAVEETTHAIYTLSCAPFPTRVGALFANTTRFPLPERVMRVVMGETLREEERVLAEPQAIAVRWPRFVFDTFEEAETTLGATSVSIGESLGIGESLSAALQIAARAGRPALDGMGSLQAHRAGAHGVPNADRFVHLKETLRTGEASIWEAQSRITKLSEPVRQALAEMGRHDLLASARTLDAAAWRTLKRFGFSDAHVAQLSHRDEAVVRAERVACGVTLPHFVRFAGTTSVLWPSWNEAAAAVPAPAPGAVMVVGSGPLRIGHGAHADASALSALAAVADLGKQAVVASRDMTGPLAASHHAEYTYLVSCDEELAFAQAHAHPGVTLRAFSETKATRFADDDASRPLAMSATGGVQIEERARSVRYPLIIRIPQRSGVSWSTVVPNEKALGAVLEEHFVDDHDTVCLEHFIASAIEIDVIAISDGARTHILASAEQVEPAGIHEADSAKVIPPYALPEAVVRFAEDATRAIGVAAKARGFVSTRFAWDGEKLWLLSASDAAPALLPLVSCMFGRDYARIAARVMLGASLAEAGMREEEVAPRRVAVRECILPFRRLVDVDPRLRPDAQSTGDVAGIGTTVARAYAKALRGMGLMLRVPREEGTNPGAKRLALFAVSPRDASASVEVAKRLHALGFDIAATEASAAMLTSMRIPHRAFALSASAALVSAIDTAASVTVVTAQTPSEISATEALRHASRVAGVPCFTTIMLARAACAALEEEGLTLDVTPIERTARNALS